MKMDARGKSILGFLSIFIFCFLYLYLTACGGNSSMNLTPSFTPPAPTDTPYPTSVIVNTTTPACIDGLTFLSDTTIVDNSIVTPGSILDKQWLVQNSGSCNWDSHYRLRLINGNGWGAAPEQALYPARAGTQATLRIIFTAPLEAGSFTSEWQAFNAYGIPFGDSFYIKITVQP
jgi:hypothetical protein